MPDDPFAKRLNNPLHRFFDALWYLVKLHLAMLIGLVTGAVVLGVFPSLFAAADVTADRHRYGEGYVFRRFLDAWKRHFVRANLFGLAVAVWGGLGFGAWYVMWYVRQPVAAVLLYAVLLLYGLAGLMVLLYYPVLFMRFPTWRPRRLTALSVLFGFGHFLTTLILLLIAAGMTLFAMFIPQFAVFILLSVLPYAATELTLKKLPGENQRRDPEEGSGGRASDFPVDATGGDRGTHPTATDGRSRPKEAATPMKGVTP